MLRIAKLYKQSQLQKEHDDEINFLKETNMVDLVQQTFTKLNKNQKRKMSVKDNLALPIFLNAKMKKRIYGIKSAIPNHLKVTPQFRKRIHLLSHRSEKTKKEKASLLLS